MPRVEQVATRQVPRFVSNSRHGADFLTGVMGIDRSRVRVIHNGIELAAARTDPVAWRSQLGLGADHFLACMVANLHQYKDHATLLRAWRIVLDRWDAPEHPPVLLLAGHFYDTAERLRALAGDLKLGESVRFLGQVQDVPGLLGTVDLGVFSSRFEGCPNAVLEYMAAGLAVAGTDIPGIREAVGPDGYEFLAAPGDVEALASHILKLASSPSLRRRARKLNARRIETEFSPGRMCAQMVDLIVDEMRARPAPEGFGSGLEHEARLTEAQDV